MIRVELAKQLRRVRTWVSLGALMVIPIIATVATRLSTESDSGTDSFYSLSEASALNNALAALAFMSPFFLVIVVSLFAGDTVAGEASWGTLRSLLLRPIPRGRLLARKLAAAGVLALGATALISIIGVVAGIPAFGWKAIDLPFFGSIPAWEGLAKLGVATAYVAWSMAGIASFSFMISTMTDVTSGAIGGGIGLAIASQILDGIRALGSIRLWLPTHHWSAWATLFAPIGPRSEMIRGILQAGAYALVFCSVAWWWFRRKDILS